MIRKTVHYSGNVQGVGFRATARGIASDYRVTGYVKNLPDGRVELVIEGERQHVDAALDEIAATMGRHIRDARVDQGGATGQFDSFEIRY